jgi:hypothetical protein
MELGDFTQGLALFVDGIEMWLLTGLFSGTGLFQGYDAYASKMGKCKIQFQTPWFD